MKSMAVIKIVELIGSSPNDWEDAMKNALAEAAKTIKNCWIQGCGQNRFRCWKKNQIDRILCEMKILKAIDRGEKIWGLEVSLVVLGYVQ
jgi:hypothetical protein